MVIKKQNWTKYGRQGDTLEIIMRDSSNAKIESWRVNSRESFLKVLKTLPQKYGDKFNSTIKKGRPESYDDELEWLRKNNIV